MIALSVAAVLAVFLVYTAVAGNSTPQLTPSQLAGHVGKVSAVGAVVGPLRGDSHAPGGLRFGLKNIQGTSGVVPVVYHGDNPPPLFAVGRHVCERTPRRERHPDEVPVEVRGRKAERVADG